MNWEYKRFRQPNNPASVSGPYLIRHKANHHLLTIQTDNGREMLGIYSSKERAKQAASDHAMSKVIRRESTMDNLEEMIDAVVAGTSPADAVAEAIKGKRATVAPAHGDEEETARAPRAAKMTGKMSQVS